MTFGKKYGVQSGMGTCVLEWCLLRLHSLSGGGCFSPSQHRPWLRAHAHSHTESLKTGRAFHLAVGVIHLNNFVVFFILKWFLTYGKVARLAQRTCVCPSPSFSKLLFYSIFFTIFFSSYILGSFFWSIWELTCRYSVPLSPDTPVTSPKSKDFLFSGCKTIISIRKVTLIQYYLINRPYYFTSCPTKVLYSQRILIVIIITIIEMEKEKERTAWGPVWDQIIHFVVRSC